MIAGYRAESALTDDGLVLETALAATPAGPVEAPQFFSGFLARPDVAAAGLLTVADVAGTRYTEALPPGRRSLDPVVTASGDRLRFESFSADNGVHARLDLLSDGIESGRIGLGTTNVDVNPPLRVALAGTGRSTLLHVAVGANGLAVAAPEQQHHERPVDLPDRWVRGFASIPEVLAAMTLSGTATGTGLTAFLAGLPSGSPGPAVHVTADSRGLRTGLAGPSSVPLRGSARVSALRRVARHAQRVDLSTGPDGSAAWVLHLPGARLTLLLSPDPYRGFSGEGRLLDDLARAGSAEDATAEVAELLAWQSVVDEAALAQDAGLAPAAVHAALRRLAASGRLGFDLQEGAWFHRDLPLDVDRIERDNPRLGAARALVAQGAVERTADGWIVRSSTVAHVDRLGEGGRCSCLWWAKHRGHRGPCKHVLAVRMVVEAAPR